MGLDTTQNKETVMTTIFVLIFIFQPIKLKKKNIIQ